MLKVNKLRKNYIIKWIKENPEVTNETRIPGSCVIANYITDTNPEIMNVKVFNDCIHFYDKDGYIERINTTRWTRTLIKMFDALAGTQYTNQQVYDLLLK